MVQDDTIAAPMAAALEFDSRPRVLVVDDEETVLTSIQGVLELRENAGSANEQGHDPYHDCHHVGRRRPGIGNHGLDGRGALRTHKVAQLQDDLPARGLRLAHKPDEPGLQAGRARVLARHPRRRVPLLGQPRVVQRQDLVPWTAGDQTPHPRLVERQRLPRRVGEQVL